MALGSVKAEPNASVAACGVVGVIGPGCSVDAGGFVEAGCVFCFFDAALLPATSTAAAFASAAALFVPRIFSPHTIHRYSVLTTRCPLATVNRAADPFGLG